jgi:hypothetical protein
LILPEIKPWVSSEDITKGGQWFPELMEQLGKTNLSVTFITPQNVRSPWVYYEVGVIAARMENAKVCPYLVGVNAKQVQDTPLGQFQWTEATKDDTWKLVCTINQHLGDEPHDEDALRSQYDAQFPFLKRQLDHLLEDMSPINDIVTRLEPSIEEQFTEEARQLLSEAVQDKHGRIIYVRTSEGTTIQANSKNMITDSTPRTEAMWKAALGELVELDLVNPIGHKGEVFEVTRVGYEVGDRINSRDSRATKGITS